MVGKLIMVVKKEGAFQLLLPFLRFLLHSMLLTLLYLNFQTGTALSDKSVIKQY